MSATLPDVAVNFTIGGLAGVKQAFADFDKLLARLGTMESSHANIGAGARVRAEHGANSSIEKSRRQLERESERASRLALRLAEREAKEKQRLIAQSAKEAERAAQQQARAADRAAREEIRAAERSAREQERQAAALARYRENVVRNSLRAEQTMRSQMDRAVTSSLVAERRKQERWAHSVGGVVGGGVSRGIGTVGRLAGIAGGLMGGFSVAAAMDAGIQEQAIAGELVRGSVETGGMSREDVIGKARGKAIELGMSPTDILSGVGAFVRKTGDLDAAMGMLDEMSKLATATGTAFEDMGSTGAEFFSQLNELGKGNQTMDVLRTLAGMGRAGAIDIKDLGQYGGRLAASAAMYDGDMVETMRSLGAAAQLARKLGGADVAEATMAVQHIGGDVSRSEAQKHLAAYGINVWADKGHTKLVNPEEIVVQAVSKTKGNLTALGEIFGERGIKAVRGAQVAYARAGGGAAGEEAIRQQFHELKTTTLSREDVDKNVADAMTEPGRQMQAAINKLNAELSGLLTLMPQLTGALQEMVPAFRKVTEWLANNANWEGLGKVVAAAIAFEIAKGGIGVLAGKAIEASLLPLKAIVAGMFVTTQGGAVAGGAAGLAGGAAGVTGGGAAALPTAARVAGPGVAIGPAIGVAFGAAAKLYYESKGEKAVDAARALIAQTEKPIEEQGGLEHARANIVALRAAKERAEGAQKYSAAAAYAPVAMVSTKSVEADALIKALPQLTQALDAATKKLNEFGGAAGDATASLGPLRDDGLADPSHPARGPIEIGR